MMNKMRSLRTLPISLALAWSEIHAHMVRSVCSFQLTTRGYSTALYYEEVEDVDPSKSLVVAMPGLLGVGRNLRSVISALVKEANAAAHSDRYAAAHSDRYAAMLLDLRCHGKSAHLSGLDGPNNLHSAASDVINTLKQKNASAEVLVGHSFGGKTCLEIVKQLKNHESSDIKMPRHVWVLDAKSGIVDTSKGVSNDVLRVLDTVAAIPTPIPSREWLYEYLQKLGFEKGLQLWLGSNLVTKSKGQMDWIFDIEGAHQLYDSYCSTSYWDLLNDPPEGTTIHIVTAARSDRWSEEDKQQLQQILKGGSDVENGGKKGRVKLHELADAGHWLHQDNPKGLVKLLLPSLVDSDDD